jgi:threonine/homoserine/homoserine lactone efflux protein
MIYRASHLSYELNSIEPSFLPLFLSFLPFFVYLKQRSHVAQASLELLVCFVWLFVFLFFCGGGGSRQGFSV